MSDRPRKFAVLPANKLGAFKGQTTAFDKRGYAVSKVFDHVPLVPLDGPDDAEPTHYGLSWVPQYEQVWLESPNVVKALGIDVADGGTAKESADFDAWIETKNLKRQRKAEP